MDNHNSLSHQLYKKAMALVLAGGRGSRLYNLTDTRAKPAVYFGGKFRIVDFALSNCLNSGIRRIGVVTQYKSHSLLRHIQRGWGFLRGELNEFIDLLPAQQRVDEESWYRGTADAVYQNIDILRSYGPEYVIVLAGDHIYKMDYSVMLRDHAQSGYKCTVGCVEIAEEEAYAFGIMGINKDREITSFIEKPKKDALTIPGTTDRCYASMGIYIFNSDYLYDLLEEDIADKESSHDFGKDIIPRVVSENQALAHPFSMSCVPRGEGVEPYWRDVGTIDAFWEANLDLAANMPELNIYDKDWPVWTAQEQLPPAKFVPDRKGNHGVITNTLTSGGCIVLGSQISKSLMFSKVKVSAGCEIDQCVIMPEVVVGENCRLKKVVIDKGCDIPAGMVIGEGPIEDAKNFYRTDKGVVLVTKKMIDELKEK
ncbi:glucose-1-phosphate adenylyltransferase [Francisella noatunensis]|uniref:Glucose-1-phosphate adenylyltransferase n=1 Tax=Francisella noatunensis TaxID=657445 RepID=A0A9Q2KX85_9GAMM|nr:glucose-1-phosphate adenylyltransferase [Francisella noatunensis]MBK2028750.1 glucose-1-phosphate adenylyltransferase [Francisella noatunensis]MBK2034430.1 glucose-1-phosphate adenylyltransferase [Francisella noatunensis]MBK2049110.1 glucose-1-phosphate adenylyltransferase [Francisella noatunensis]MBK2049643.1 glucose-1-phosphate adenylyltransferase [Francisella noatunensis]MBK2051536.1 glucose-1-phosphate adenylyltransferase [Francisella noatunensis]